MNNLFWIIEFFSVLIALVLGLAVGYLYKQNQVEKVKREQIDEAERLVEDAKQSARQIEIKARDQAIELIQKAENDLDRKRADLSKEEDRLQKRREELDNRVDRTEKREQALNKRQSTIDKRTNEIDKLYEQQMEELQRISQMTDDEARTYLLANVEKESRTDMARIIRQVEAEAREDGGESSPKNHHCRDPKSCFRPCC